MLPGERTGTLEFYVTADFLLYEVARYSDKWGDTRDVWIIRNLHLWKKSLLAMSNSSNCTHTFS